MGCARSQEKVFCLCSHRQRCSSTQGVQSGDREGKGPTCCERRKVEGKEGCQKREGKSQGGCQKRKGKGFESKGKSQGGSQKGSESSQKRKGKSRKGCKDQKGGSGKSKGKSKKGSKSQKGGSKKGCKSKKGGSSKRKKGGEKGKEAYRVRPQCKYACGGVIWLRIVRCNHIGLAPSSPQRRKPIGRAIAGLIPHQLSMAVTFKTVFPLWLHTKCREQCDAL